jgi:hypothetical protein
MAVLERHGRAALERELHDGLHDRLVEGSELLLDVPALRLQNLAQILGLLRAAGGEELHGLARLLVGLVPHVTPQRREIARSRPRQARAQRIGEGREAGGAGEQIFEIGDRRAPPSRAPDPAR